MLSNVVAHDAVKLSDKQLEQRLTSKMENHLVGSVLDKLIVDFWIIVDDVDVGTSSFSGQVQVVGFVNDCSMTKEEATIDFARSPFMFVAEILDDNDRLEQANDRKALGLCAECGDAGEWIMLQLTCRNGHGRICG